MFDVSFLARLCVSVCFWILQWHYGTTDDVQKPLLRAVCVCRRHPTRRLLKKPASAFEKIHTAAKCKTTFSVRVTATGNCVLRNKNLIFLLQMHVRVDITPPISRFALACALLVAFEMLWLTAIRSTYLAVRADGSFVHLMVVYGVAAWGLAALEHDAQCESSESYLRLSAAWGTMVGSLTWVFFNATYVYIDKQWSVKHACINSAGGIGKCIAVMLCISSIFF